MNIISDKLNLKALLVINTVSAWLVLLGGSAVADFEDEAKTGAELGGTTTTSAENIFQKIIDLLLFLIGAVSVIMIIIGGIRFILSRGDPQAAATARNTVMYAVIGLAVAVLAWAIVTFVLGELYGTTDSITTPTAPEPAPAGPTP